MGTFSKQIDRALASVTKERRADPSDSRMSAIVRDARRQGPTTPGMYRSWSIHAPMVRANIDHVKNACRRAEWELVPFSTDLPAPDKGLIRAQYEVLHRPNPEDSSFGEMLDRVVEDILTLDAGVLEKERKFKGELIAIHPTMGEYVKVDRFWNGDPRSPRYWWEPDPHISESFLNDNMIYQRLHPRTNSGVGISYLETAKNTIDNLLAASTYNGRMVKRSVPDGVFDLGETARPDQVERFKAYFAAELEGKEALAFWGGTRGSKFINFRGPGNSNRDMQYEEWLQFELRILCAVFHTSPQDFAFGFDINKANGEVQQENTESNASLPVLEKVQDYLTAEFCQDRMWGGISNNIAFRFRAVSLNQTLAKAQIHKISVAGMPTQTVNEARRDIGLPPIAPPDFNGDVMGPENPYNQLMANTSQGLVLLSDPMTAREMAERETPPQLPAGNSEKQPS